MTTTDITFPTHDGRAMRAAFAAPSDGRTHPAVIVIHEIFGLNDDIRRMTGRVADLGYAARAQTVGFRDAVRERDDPFGDYGSGPRSKKRAKKKKTGR